MKGDQCTNLQELTRVVAGHAIYPDDKMLDKRKAFAERQAKEQEQLLRLFRKAGIDAIQLRTDRDYGAELGKFFENREKRRLRG